MPLIQGRRACVLFRQTGIETDYITEPSRSIAGASVQNLAIADRVCCSGGNVD